MQDLLVIEDLLSIHGTYTRIKQGSLPGATSFPGSSLYLEVEVEVVSFPCINDFTTNRQDSNFLTCLKVVLGKCRTDRIEASLSESNSKCKTAKIFVRAFVRTFTRSFHSKTPVRKFRKCCVPKLVPIAFVTLVQLNGKRSTLGHCR